MKNKNKHMKNLYDYREFVNEAKKKAKEMTDQERVMDGVKNILDGNFAFAKKPEYKNNKDGFPTQVKFLVDENDYKLKWDKETLKTEFSDVVALKHIYDVEMKFVSKEKTEDDKFWMVFDIKFKKVSEKEKLPKWREEVKSKKKKDEDDEEETGSKDEEWYGKEDEEEEDEEEMKKKATKAAEKEEEKKEKKK